MLLRFTSQTPQVFPYFILTQFGWAFWEVLVQTKYLTLILVKGFIDGRQCLLGMPYFKNHFCAFKNKSFKEF